MNLVTLGLPYFPDPSIGRPVYKGSIYIGEPDLDPTVEANQKDVYVRQEDGTTTLASQPIATSAGGVPTYNGYYVQILVSGGYSLAIRDLSDVQVYYIPNMFDLAPLTSDRAILAYQFDSVADLKTGTMSDGGSLDLSSEYEVKTKGFRLPGDGGGATYLIQTAAEFGETPDEFVNHTLDNGNIAVMQVLYSVDAKQAGALGDGIIDGETVSGTDDTDSFEAALNSGYDVSVSSPLNDAYIVSPDRCVVGGLSGATGKWARMFGVIKNASAETYPRIIHKNGTTGELFQLHRGSIDALTIESQGTDYQVGIEDLSTPTNIGIRIGDGTTGAAKNFDNCQVTRVRMNGFFFQVYADQEVDNLKIEQINSVDAKVGHSQIYIHANADQSAGSAGMEISKCHLDAGSSPDGYGLFGVNLGGVDFAEIDRVISNDHNIGDFRFGGANKGTNILMSACHSECNNVLGASNPSALIIDGKATYVQLSTCRLANGSALRTADTTPVSYSPVIDIQSQARVVATNVLATAKASFYKKDDAIYDPAVEVIGESVNIVAGATLTGIGSTFEGDFTKATGGHFINLNSAVTDDTIGDVGSSSFNGGGLTGLTALVTEAAYFGNALASKPRITYGTAAPSDTPTECAIYFRIGGSLQVWAFNPADGIWVGLNFQPTETRRGPLKMAGYVNPATGTVADVVNALIAAGHMSAS